MGGSEMAVEPHAGVVAGEDAEGHAVWCLESWNRRRKIEHMKRAVQAGGSFKETEVC